MKTLIKIIFVFITFNVCTAQLSTDFFPANPGFKWKFKLTPLDSTGNPISELSINRIDSFAYRQIYQTKNSNVIFSTTFDATQFFLDTNYIHLESTNGWVFTKLFWNLDSIQILDTLGLTKFLKNFIGWNLYYRFAQNTGVEYTIKSRDTTIIINNQTYPIRAKITGRRFNDEQVQITAGNFNSKKFLLKYSLNYLVILFGNTYEIPVITIPETSWIAQSLWIVKTTIPPVSIDLSFLNFGKYKINGLMSELIEYKPLSADLYTYENFLPRLYQNYPNPFNTSTVISYEIPKSGNVTIIIYDILGSEITTLFTGLQQTGTYSINWNANDLASGVYYYKITLDGFSKTNKMVLIK